MNTQYINIDQLKDNNNASVAQRVALKERKLFQPAGYFYSTDASSGDNGYNTELHVYIDDNWITGNHNVSLTDQFDVSIETEYTSGTNSYNFPVTPVSLNLKRELDNLNVNAGEYQIIVNSFRDIIGSYTTQHLKVKEISPDRTEIRLDLIDESNPNALLELTRVSKLNLTSDTGLHETYLLNFSRNNVAKIINTVVIGSSLYVKLLQPVSEDIENNFQAWIVQELKQPYSDFISIESDININDSINQLSNPNWDADADYRSSTETGYKTWSSLLGSGLQTSQQIINNYFSGSLQGIELNIDYSDFNNFVFYGSAVERLENYKYKLDLIEFYTSQSNVVQQLSGSAAVTSSNNFINLKDNVISDFDNFEKYLYYESSSVLFSNEYPRENPNVARITGSYIQPSPKQTSTKPYTLYSIYSSVFKNWYDDVLEDAKTYDEFNKNSLINVVPSYIKFDQNNVGVATFVNMLGHHYDIIYTYVNHITKLNDREENPKLGMPNELLYDTAKQFGWELLDGKQSDELWKYLFGTDETGVPATGSNSVNNESLPSKDIVYGTWRRIVNNIPGLLKTKGTKRSIQSLLACYGIPQSLITIKEYGGPRLDRKPVYEKYNFDYALDLINNTAGTVDVDYTADVNSIELRFRTDNIVDTPTMPSTMNIFSVGSIDITTDFTSGTKGTIQLNGTSSAELELFDGSWTNLLLKVSGFDLFLFGKKSKYGKLITTVSCSTALTSGPSAIEIPSTGTITIGSTSGGSRLQGQIQELRLWSSSLNNEPYENHTKAPAAYDGNVDSYNELLFRLPLTQNIDHSLTSSLNGVEPNPSNISASFSSWTNDIPYNSYEETYYYDGISLAAGTFDDNKVRIESNNLTGTLDAYTRAERSQFDTAPLDSKKLGIYFSPQTMINEDIISQLGFRELDSFIGDPGDLDENEYSSLIQEAISYWKKYTQKNDINAYIKIFSLFDMSFFQQINQLLPARADKLTGLLVQPNILERSKQSILPKTLRENNLYETVLDVYEDIEDAVTSSINDYSAIITSSIQDNVIGSYDNYLTTLNTTNDFITYNGTRYSNDYRILSGGMYITGSTPYWLSEAVLPTITGSTVSEFKTTVTVLSGSVISIGPDDGSIKTLSGNKSGEYLITNFTTNPALGTGLTFSVTGSYSPSLNITQYTNWSVVTSGSGYISGSDITFTEDEIGGSPSGTTTIQILSVDNSSKIYTYTLDVESQDYLPTALANSFYNGSKMSSPSINQNSNDTVDGGPVVETNIVNPNQLIVQSPTQDQGIFNIQNVITSIDSNTTR